MDKGYTMVSIITKKDWALPENSSTPEELYLNRREFLHQLGVVGNKVLGLYAASYLLCPMRTWALEPEKKIETNISSQRLAVSYNNYYEFSGDPSKVSSLMQNFKTNPWTVRVNGLVKKPRVLDWDQLVSKFSIES